VESGKQLFKILLRSSFTKPYLSPQTTGAEQDEWRVRTQGLLDGASVFFRRDSQIMIEVACEPRGNCNVDQRSFKAYLARWMAATTKLAPWTHDTIMPLLQTSAQAAADTCTGGDAGTTCGMRWWQGQYDGNTGVGEQMCALEIFQSNLIDSVPGPVSQKTGGISKGDPDAGTTSGSPIFHKPITTGDRAGAGILTALMVVTILGGAWWLVRS
jgi:mannan endo-1,6-alpha-mannosidase